MNVYAVIERGSEAGFGRTEVRGQGRDRVVHLGGQSLCFRGSGHPYRLLGRGDALVGAGERHPSPGQ